MHVLINMNFVRIVHNYSQGTLPFCLLLTVTWNPGLNIICPRFSISGFLGRLLAVYGALGSIDLIITMLIPQSQSSVGFRSATTSWRDFLTPTILFDQVQLRQVTWTIF